MINFKCRCGEALEAPDSLAAENIDCPACATTQTVPPSLLAIPAIDRLSATRTVTKATAAADKAQNAISSYAIVRKLAAATNLLSDAFARRLQSIFSYTSARAVVGAVSLLMILFGCALFTETETVFQEIEALILACFGWLGLVAFLLTTKRP